jgi:prevent-host-death family protein
MTSVGSFEAKTRLPALLERVARGENILITRRGQPVGMLVPPPQEPNEASRGDVVQAMLQWRDSEGPTLGGKVTVRKIIEEGRRR